MSWKRKKQCVFLGLLLEKVDFNSEKQFSKRNFIQDNEQKLQQNVELDDHNNLNKLNKLNLLRNLSKMNKNNRDYSPELLKDEIYKKGRFRLI